MEFTVSSSELLRGLMSVSRVIVSKPSLAILEDFLFVLKEKTSGPLVVAPEDLLLLEVKI